MKQLQCKRPLEELLYFLRQSLATQFSLVCEMFYFNRNLLQRFTMITGTLLTLSIHYLSIPTAESSSLPLTL